VGRARGRVALTAARWCYLGGDTARRLAWERRLGPGTAWQSIAEPLEDAARRLREPFLAMVADLAERNDGLLWWSSGLANKNPYTAALFLRCCFLALAHDRAQDEGLRFVVESRALRRALQGLVGGARVRAAAPSRPHASLAAWRWTMRRHLRRRAALRRAGVRGAPAVGGADSVLFVTWVDERNVAAEGRYHDPYFGDALPARLQRRGTRVAYLAHVLAGVDFTRMVARLHRTRETFVFPEALLRPSDVLHAVVAAARHRPRLSTELRLGGMDVGPLVREQIADDRAALPADSLHATLARRLHESGVVPGSVVHMQEGHPWERAFALGARTAGLPSRLVGYNTGTFSPMLLCMYPDPRELARMPLPDRIVTNGPCLREALLGAGYPAARVVPGADLRRAHLWNGTPSASRGSGDAVVLVATEVDTSRSIELVDKAIRAVAGLAGHRVIVRCHPLVDPSRIRAALGVRAEAPNVEFSARPLAALLDDADALLYTQTAVCFEALRHGVAPIFVRSEGALNLDPLTHAPECRAVATTPDDIRAAVHRARTRSPGERARWYDSAQRVLAHHLAPADDAVLDAFLA